VRILLTFPLLLLLISSGALADGVAPTRAGDKSANPPQEIRPGFPQGTRGQQRHRMVRDDLFGWSTNEGHWERDTPDTPGAAPAKNPGDAYDPDVSEAVRPRLRQILSQTTFNSPMAKQVLKRGILEDRLHRERIADLEACRTFAQTAKDALSTARTQDLLSRERAAYGNLVRRIVRLMAMADRMQQMGGDPDTMRSMRGMGGMGHAGGLGDLGDKSGRASPALMNSFQSRMENRSSAPPAGVRPPNRVPSMAPASQKGR